MILSNFEKKLEALGDPLAEISWLDSVEFEFLFDKELYDRRVIEVSLDEDPCSYLDKYLAWEFYDTKSMSKEPRDLRAVNYLKVKTRMIVDCHYLNGRGLSASDFTSSSAKSGVCVFFQAMLNRDISDRFFEFIQMFMDDLYQVDEFWIPMSEGRSRFHSDFTETENKVVEFFCLFNISDDSAITNIDEVVAKQISDTLFYRKMISKLQP